MCPQCNTAAVLICILFLYKCMLIVVKIVICRRDNSSLYFLKIELKNA